MKIKKNWKRLFLKYFDWNQSGSIEWWEYLIPLSVILAIEIIAELFAKIIVG